MKVTAPDGTRWKVGRQWWPDRKSAGDATDVPLPDGGGGGDGGSWFDLGDAATAASCATRSRQR